jgi:hypothetical protein
MAVDDAPSTGSAAFASPYRKVPYFGIWADEPSDQYGKRDAITMLADAAGCCFDDHVRQRRVLKDAFDYPSVDSHHRFATASEANQT